MRLIFGMGLLLAVLGEEKVVVPVPLGLVTLRLMGMVKKIGINGYALVDVLSNESEEEDDEPEDTSDIQATPPPKGESMDIEATTVAQGAPSELDSLST